MDKVYGLCPLQHLGWEMEMSPRSGLSSVSAVGRDGAAPFTPRQEGSMVNQSREETRPSAVDLVLGRHFTNFVSTYP